MSNALDFTERATVLVVDDTPENLQLMASLLKDDYKVKVANSGERGLAIAAASPRPDLILLDIMMPGIDGYEVCQRLKADAATQDIPVIFLTAKAEVEDEARGFALGAVDYITKPVSPPIVAARVRTQLTLKSAADFLKDKANYLEQEVARRAREVVATQDATILAMASLAEARDDDSGQHLLRVQNYVKMLARQLRAHPRFNAYLTQEQVEVVYNAAALHDIGKIGLPDSIVQNPGRYTPDEFQLMTMHAAYGRDALLAAEKRLETPSPTLTCAREIAGSHHERWDGSGYPEGLQGEAIPIAARLMSVADTYDALLRARPWRAALTHEQAVATIAEGAGAAFDPDVVAAFADIADAFYSIAARYAEGARA